MAQSIHRREFARQAGLAAASFIILKEARSARGYPANEKLGIALVGCGGRGEWFVDTVPNLESIVALCDVNEERAAKSYAKLPKPPKYHDFRKMLDERDREIDGVIIATPDQIHAPCTLHSLRMHKPVFCEKPLTQNIHEARVVRTFAVASKVATQLGNQGTSSETFRRALELIDAGVIGEVREVHAWNESGGPGPWKRPEGEQPVPKTLQWDLWLGPSSPRPYHQAWMNWHGWREFGTGQLGNWASHTMNLPFKGLKLDTLWDEPAQGPGADVPLPGPKIKVQAEVDSICPLSFPRWEMVTYEFPARGHLPPVTIRWYNGHNIPDRERKKIEALLGRRLDWGDAGEKKWADYAGCLLLGSKGTIHATGHNMSFTLLPEEKFRDFEGPPKVLPRVSSHETEWFQAIRGGPQPMSRFEYGGRLAEFTLLGNIATQFEGPIEYDTVMGLARGPAHVDRCLGRDYRTGWELIPKPG